MLLQLLKDRDNAIILGDFNEDALSTSYTKIKELMQKNGYFLTSSEITHKQGACLDHIYLQQRMQTAYRSCTCVSSYYTDHYYVIM
ncbi:hypothetical protein DPMN_070654 [Dreissena polymorpha]|uniref:Endonuclease/exonuclease/phosphatase domain-containing protein n=1 Tax=Dreissena polymorpha TaxID=45954 RepID=A0A9D4BVS7_DREPO|nr:hypothetical protein DPMN_070654 [Dreissena polymorpha]